MKRSAKYLRHMRRRKKRKALNRLANATEKEIIRANPARVEKRVFRTGRSLTDVWEDLLT